MLAFGVRYLNGWAMAAHPSDRRSAEWPPHPDRIFMAMAAAHFETERSPEQRAVLEWLETLDPPELLASIDSVQHRTVLSCYVPPNDLYPPDPGSHANGTLVRSIREDEFDEAALNGWLAEIRRIRKANVVPRVFDFLELRDRLRSELHKYHLPDRRITLQQALSDLQNEIAAIDWKSYVQEALGLLPQFRAMNLKERCFPVAVPESEQLFLIWPDVEPSELQQRLLDELCSQVIRIGHSASFVQMWVADGIPEVCIEPLQRLAPNDAGRHRLRVTRAGRLANLESRYNEANVLQYAEAQKQLSDTSLTSLDKKVLRKQINDRFGKDAPRQARPESIVWRGYQLVKPQPSEPTVTRSKFADMIVLKQTDGPRFGLESTLQLTEHFRKLVMKFSNVQPVPEWLSGHRPDGKSAAREFGHTAFVPISHVSWQQADGHLLGMAIVPPRDIAPIDIARALHPVLYAADGSSNKLTLKMGHGGTCSLEITDGSEGQSGLQSSAWTRSASAWATVTPIALDRHTKGKKPWDEMASIISKACVRIGLPAPVDVIPSAVSMFTGARTTADMPRIERKSGGRIQQTHAILKFDQPVAGPILLGAGRYRGYGLCRPLDGRN